MEAERIQRLNRAPPGDGEYVLYWMQQSQRAAFNHALEYAIDLANERDEPVVACFGLTPAYPEARRRHYAFMLEGLAEVAEGLAERGVRFVVRLGSPDEVAIALAQNASIVVCDRGYLRHQREWRQRVAAAAGRTVIQVESDLVVPVEAASRKPELAARTIRPRILARRDEFLVPLKEHRPNADATRLSLAGNINLSDVGSTLDRLGLDGTVGPVGRFRGGASAARERLRDFLGHRFQGYAERRSELVARACSELSPYLHFGQISPIEVALAARAASPAGKDDKAAFLEELVVRRELAANFTHYRDDYDRFDCLPAWAVATLEAHAADRREHVYGLDALEGGRTHDNYWNGAMREMRETGYMHNYMRMYWAKKIIEWTSDPREAYATVLHLNNKLFLGGRDFNSFANVGWCFGLQDRPWPERPIFGTVRYMNAKGLERKFDISAYVRWTGTL